jgi:hypothetical protein
VLIDARHLWRLLRTPALQDSQMCEQIQTMMDVNRMSYIATQQENPTSTF